MSKSIPEFFNHPFLKKDKVKFRHYQNNIVKISKNKNTLVVLPTGLGKTIIGILLIAHSLEKYNKRAKIIILAPTRPLVSQHRSSCEKFLNLEKEEICLLTGKISPEKRILAFKKSKIIVSTPQVIKNDLMRGRYNLKHTALIIFDEAHRAKGNYAYTFISDEYIKCCSDPLILSLTASPGKDEQHIQELCDSLYIEKVIFKNYEDNDVKDYINDIEMYLERVELPIKYIELCEIWNHLFNKFLKFFIDRELINPYKKYYSKLDFLHISKILSLSLKYDEYSDSDIRVDENSEYDLNQLQTFLEIVKNKKINIHSIYSYCSTCISILHGKELLETQEIELFNSFLKRLEHKADNEIMSAK
ncbi:MAG: DEAD/DEAH box helicase, partial [Candidatus Hermodarchaeota archaeon]